MSEPFDLFTHPKRYVTVADLASFVCVERRTIVRMIHAGSLLAVKVGRAWRVDTASARDAFHGERNRQLRAS